MDQELLSLALKSQPNVMLEAADYLLASGNAEAAALLYQKGGHLAKALEMAFNSGLYDVLDCIAEAIDKDSNPGLMTRWGAHGLWCKGSEVQRPNLRHGLSFMCMLFASDLAPHQKLPVYYIILESTTTTVHSCMLPMFDLTIAAVCHGPVVPVDSLNMLAAAGALRPSYQLDITVRLYRCWCGLASLSVPLICCWPMTCT